MSGIASGSASELGQRRAKLRALRSERFFQMCWQTLGVSGLAAASVWAISQPAWVIHQPEQISVFGNKFLSSETIRSLLPMKYPQSLLSVQPQEIAQKLETAAPIAKATVHRHLFPPGLTVHIKERYPVAIAQLSQGALDAKQKDSGNSTSLIVGVLDENGWWTPLKNYTALQQTIPLPSLKVIGNPSNYRENWPQLYQTLSQSPVKVSEVDWQDSGNVILKTEIGTVHLGPYSSKFDEQLQVIDRMRQLPKHPRYSQIAYIDLKNPQSPAIKLQPGKIQPPAAKSP
ncbi:cell division protein FtsQ/DivIB [Ancylothrix sp. D3o]|uniref:cell division protein FtsQ/DivIB n=1 Tax=Ancylothrix sp. D3o TaxID=2953691 RepID=UPI0021BAAD8D|nr:FtsQ-type POTRA domain-containing protein [Ancylothrix sp. D3o]